MKKILVVVFILSIFTMNMPATDTSVKSLGLLPWMTGDETLALEMFPQLITNDNNIISIETTTGDTEGWLGLKTGAGNFGLVVNKQLIGAFTSIKQSGIIYGWRNHDLAAGGSVYFGQKDLENIILPTDSPLNLGTDREYSGDSVLRLQAGFSWFNDMPFDAGITVDIPEDVNEVTEMRDAFGLLESEVNDTENGVESKLDARLSALDMLFYLNAGYAYEDDVNTDKEYTLGSLSLYTQDQSVIHTCTAAVGASKVFKAGFFEITAGLQVLYKTSAENGTSKDLLNNSLLDGTDEVDSYFINAPLFLGVEAAVNSMVKLRFGMNKSAFSTGSIEVTDRDASGNVTLHTKDTYKNSNTVNFSFGIGLDMAGAAVDVLVSNGLLYNGPNFISGIDTGWLTKAGVSYSWM